VAGELEGKILWRGEPGYEEARLKPARSEADWNARRVDRYPDAVVQATSDQDVVAAVRLARERGLKVKARSGGHSWVDSSIRDGGILVDLSQLNEVIVDPATRTAIAGPGTKSQELFPHLKPHGLCFPSGGCRDVGLGGYVLQGGFGFNGGRIGLAAMNVLAMEVVTADGELVRADEHTNPDLFWAARGSGSGFFGIVTRFHLRLHPLPGAVRARAYFFAADDAEAVLRWSMELHQAGAPAGLDIGMFALPRFAETVAPGALLNLWGVAHTDTEDQALAALQVLESCPVASRALVRTPVMESDPSSPGEQLRDVYPDGLQYVADNLWIDAAPDQLLPHLRNLLTSFPTPRSHLLFHPFTQHDLPDFAFSMEGQYYLAVYGVAEPTDNLTDEQLAAWTTTQMQRLEHLSRGFQFADENLICRPWPGISEAHNARLEALRAVHDPDGLFHSYLLG